MNWDQIKGDWCQLSPRLKHKWTKLTEVDLKAVAGERDRLEDLLRDRYGYTKDQAVIELDKFARQVSS
jgi:uncharacterized protein YjbJ (UPF0337 family)